MTAAPDVYFDVLGLLLGAVAGLGLGRPVRRPFAREVAVKPVPSLLLAAWGRSSVFRMSDRDVHNIGVVVSRFLYPTQPPSQVGRYALAHCRFAERGGHRAALVVRFFALAAIALFVAKVVIVDNAPNPVDTVASRLVFPTWLLLLPCNRR
jgi:hypothetical protein